MKRIIICIHTFFVQTDGAVKITLTIGNERKTILETTSREKRDQVSAPITLRENAAYPIEITYRSPAAGARLKVQMGTSPDRRQNQGSRYRGPHRQGAGQ